MLDHVFSALLQLFFFTLVPFIVHLTRVKTHRGFFQFIGLFKAHGKALKWATAIGLALASATLALIWLSEGMHETMTNPKSVTGKIREMGLSAESVVVLVLIAWVKTALAEEILFRGFLAKRFIALWGFWRGNVIQSFIFAAIHSILFWYLIEAPPLFLVVIFVVPFLAAIFIAYVNEVVGNGSILPGWVAHGLGNCIAYVFVGFVL